MTATVGFDEFYEAVHGYGPFPWQSDLAASVHRAGAWPDVLDIPTGLGKTSVIDIAVWLAATTGCALGSPGRRRTFFVIDRRVVVDEAFAHATAIDRALRAGGSAPIRDVADALRDLTGDISDDEGSNRSPLPVARMRGGVTWDWRWLDRPDRPAVVVGTVDQLGSRFLFRAYGLSGELAPIDAALVGTDSLLVIDEAHLSRPLIETIEAVAGLDSSPIQAARPIVVPMSATLAKDPGRTVHRMSSADREHTVARRRLEAPKRLHVLEVGGAARSRAERTEATMADLAVAVAGRDRVQAVAVICNTVGRARAVFDRLRKETRVARLENAGRGADVGLLTGRVRPWNREQLMARYLPSAGAGRRRTDRPLTILVTTQTIEVGANLDFDALVTESGSWDALVQRLGRLNRLGDHDDAEHPCHALVVHDGLPSFLYAEARERTWDFLVSRTTPIEVSKGVPDLSGGLPASPKALAELIEGVDLSELSLVPQPGPAVLTAHLDTWVKTSPIPATDVPVAPFLHGYDTSSPEVRLVWRADLPDLPSQERRERAWSTLVDALPPTNDEALELPLGAFGAWVRHHDDPVAGAIVDQTGPNAAPDGEGSAAAPSEKDPEKASAVERRKPAPRFSALRWRGPDDAELIDLPAQMSVVRPGDLLVLAASAGGCDDFGWAPTSTAPVRDLADLSGGAPGLRLWPAATRCGTLAALDVQLTDKVEQELAEALEEAWTGDDLDPVVDVAEGIWHDDLALGCRWIPDVSGTTSAVRAAWVDRSNADLSRHLSVQFAPGSRRNRWTRRFSGDGGNDPAGSSNTNRPVSLQRHLRAVEERVRSIGEKLNLELSLVEACAIAAAWHDTGKLDRRFQINLHGGDDLATDAALATGEPLAKSGMNPRNRRAFTDAFRASGLPSGFRHEVASAVAVADHISVQTDLDADLILHLVGSHHGRGRPLFPPVEDRASPWTLEWKATSVKIDPADSIDWSGPTRFADLNQRYGRWGLALLEAVVRLADIGCSEEGT